MPDADTPLSRAYFLSFFESQRKQCMESNLGEPVDFPGKHTSSEHQLEKCRKPYETFPNKRPDCGSTVAQVHEDLIGAAVSRT